jgi:voltage-gated potassium channel
MRRSAEAYERFQRQAEAPMLVLALAFGALLVIPWAVDLSAGAQDAITTATWLIWGAFVVEYLALLYLAPSRWQMVRTHVLDLVIIALPFLRPLRALRLLRLVSVAGRAGVALNRIATRPGFRGFLAFALVVIVGCAAGLYAFERGHPDATIGHFGDALWWAIVTATTVGYGDHYPVTAEGRGVAVVLMLLGIGIFSVVTANIAAYFVEEHDDQDADVAARLERIERLLLERSAQESAASGGR